MQFSERWLRSFVDPPLDSDALAHALSMAGLEVEDRRPVAPCFHGVVVGQVLAVERHPRADRLSVCKVDVGHNVPLTIVCGAPNVKTGAKAACAPAGTTLPGGVINHATVRGVDSQGMLCSARELGLSDEHDGLLLLDDDAPTGADLRTVLDLDDNVFTLKLTPNRADCLCLAGIAREVGAMSGVLYALRRFDLTPADDSWPRAVRIEDPEACPRFCARAIHRIDARKPTPAWIRRRLERSGIRLVSAVVDVTNYVMLELGQPLHAYDDAKLQGDIIVRFARPGESLRLLNGETLELAPDLLLVADEKKALGLAGIMGGDDTSIGDATTDVYLEGAFWNPAVIQGKARRLGFATDAAQRFERGIDFANCAQAVERATTLIVEICGGHASALVDVQGKLPERNPVRVRASRVDRLLGVALAPETIDECFARLRFEFVREHDHYRVTPPSYRFDLSIEEDFVEEVARIYGYERIAATAAPHVQHMLPAPEGLRSLYDAKAHLAALGYQEVITYSFVNSAEQARLGLEPRAVRVLNPIAAHQDVMRTTLLVGLLDTLQTNLNYKAERVRIFEAGRCFVGHDDKLEQPTRLGVLSYGLALPDQWGAERRWVDFFDVKSDLESLARPGKISVKAREYPALHPGRSAEVLVGAVTIGWLGELHPRLVQALELPRAPVVFEVDWAPLVELQVPKAKAISRLPAVRRDLALVVDDAVPAQSVVDGLRRVAPPYVQCIWIFDCYRGQGIEQGKKSLAVLVLMQDTERTLTDAEIDATMGVLIAEAQSQFGATLRSQE